MVGDPHAQPEEFDPLPSSSSSYNIIGYGRKRFGKGFEGRGELLGI